MKRRLLSMLAIAASFALAGPAFAASNHFWQITSPDHGQTYTYGSETNRVWKGWHGHLELLLTYTNDPFVDRQNPRQWDNFTLNFPSVRLGADGRTFYYHAPGGRSIPVAVKRSDFLGFDEVKLLPNAEVFVATPSGYVTASLNVIDPDGLALK